MRELCDEGVSAALFAGASYADARVVLRRNQTVATRNHRVDRLDDMETEGLGVRVLVGGAWGFACDRRLSTDGGSSAQAGWEYVESLAFEREAPRVAEQAAALLRADPCPSQVTTVVIDAEQMELQVHESVGHPTELDRVYRTEAAYAGTSFLKPEDLGPLRYGSGLMNITADPTTPGGLGTFGFDDEGVPAAPMPIVAE